MNWHDIFEYRDGLLIRKVKVANVSKVGEVAGRVDKFGYVILKYRQKAYRCHRVVWEMHNRAIPKGMFIDHINRNKSDNRIENLRLVTPQDNSRNMGKNKRNSSGFNGVCFDSKLCKYRAYIGVDDKMVSIGNYDTIEKAVLARIEKNKELGFFNDHGVGISK